LTSNSNWVAGQAPTPNAVTAALSADGRLGLYNLTGTVDVLVDIVGYYELSTSGPGPQGLPGPSGLPLVGQFTPTQIVEGAVLTCALTQNVSVTSICVGPKLNGLDLSDTEASLVTICNTVTGTALPPSHGFGPLSTATRFVWTGTTWALQTINEAPLQQVGCHL
jgi:hypothetical protein